MPEQKRRYIRRKVFVFTVCVLLSTLLWLLSTLNKVQSSVIQIPVEFTGIPYDLVASTTLPSTIDITIEAPGFMIIWAELTTKKHRIEVPLKLKRDNILQGKSYHINLNTYISDISKSFSNNIKIRKIFPDTLGLVFQSKHIKKVPVQFNYDVSFFKEFAQSEPVLLSPDSVFISGTEENINKIKAVKTKKLLLNGVNKTYTGIIGLERIEGISFSTENIGVELPVEQFTEKKIEVVVTVLDLPEDMELDLIPNKVNLNLLVPLSVYNNLTPEQFQVAVRFPGRDAKIKRLIPEVIRKSPYIRVLNIQPSAVEYIIKETPFQ